MDLFDEIQKEQKDFPKMKVVSKEMHKQSLNFYQWFAIVIFVLCFFLGIILGNLFSICETSSYFYSDACLVKQFNFSLTVVIWFCSLLLSLFIFAIGHIIALLTDINKKLGKFRA